MTNDSVHNSHCCLKHGCKYGEDDCPVDRGAMPGIMCEDCCEDPDMCTVCQKVPLHPKDDWCEACDVQMQAMMKEIEGKQPKVRMDGVSVDGEGEYESPNGELSHCPHCNKPEVMWYDGPIYECEQEENLCEYAVYQVVDTVNKTFKDEIDRLDGAVASEVYKAEQSEQRALIAEAALEAERKRRTDLIRKLVVAHECVDPECCRICELLTEEEE